MQAFSQMGIKSETDAFTGDKIKIVKILNKQVIVNKFRIVPSKYADKGNGKRLDLQITYNEETHIVFTGSGNLMGMIEQVKKDCFPFTTTIVDNNGVYQFT